jgi:hypothetical protein
MADLPDTWQKEFADLGEEEVRKRLGMHIWAEKKGRLARQWLELRSTSLAREANDLAGKANDAAKEANDIARSNNFTAGLALFGAAIAITISIIGLFLKRG